jgi:hypothetical protein
MTDSKDGQRTAGQTGATDALPPGDNARAVPDGSVRWRTMEATGPGAPATRHDPTLAHRTPDTGQPNRVRTPLRGERERQDDPAARPGNPDVLARQPERRFVLDRFIHARAASKAAAATETSQRELPLRRR